jgi:hypothetical protein
MPTIKKSPDLKLCRMVKVYEDINPAKYEPCSLPQSRAIIFFVFLV